MMRDLRPSYVHVARARCVQTALLAAALTLACEDTSRPTQPEVTDFWVLQIVSGDKQVGASGLPLPQPLVVRVTNSRNSPVAGASIQWSPTDSRLIDPVQSTTDAQGMASVRRTLGVSAGAQIAIAWIVGDTANKVIFTSTGLVQGATDITQHPISNGDNQRDTVQARLAPLRVLVRDHENAPVTGVVVQWSFYGRGSLSSATSATDANGVAQITYDLGTIAGEEVVLATVPGLIGSPVLFKARVVAGAPARTLAIGDGQVGRVGSVLGYQVRVTDAWGNGVPTPAGVDWAVTSGGGSIVPGAPGYAAHTLGASEGLHTATATVRNAPAIAPAQFSARAVTETVFVGADFYCYGYTTFLPATVVVASGRTVGWLWDGFCGAEHDVTFEDEPRPPVSSALKRDGAHVRTFTGAPRTIRFRCTRHSTNFDTGMVGRVTIQ